ncbi:fibronectin type III domain-containing protein [Rhizohabitans arisaemae]|uniref:fibronectin type III domain-containing protein n=1 Tax=Rhizohabitans arisaemae TaxID=2720610 RepID=UPI0024B1A296|nr:cellulose binding domain-containing protein [Rhizohabitans arisaemae]
MRLRKLTGVFAAVLLAAATTLIWSGPTRAASGSAQAVVPPLTPTATVVKTQDWGSGWQGQVTITNGSGAGLLNWRVEFDLPAGYAVTSAWDARLTRNGQRFIFENLSWNGTIPNGGTRSFGLIGSPGGSGAVPQNCSINNYACDGGDLIEVPSGVRITGVTDTSITVAWNASSGRPPAGYRVWNGNTLAATVTGTTATVTGLNPCSAHTFTVTAHNISGNQSARSQPVTGTTTGCENLPGRPSGLRTTAATVTSVTLAWETPTGTVTGYRVYQNGMLKTTVTGTAATVSGLSACTPYSFTVSAYNTFGESPQSNALSHTTGDCPTNPGVAAPYLYTGWGSPPNPATVMNATGIKWFTMAFVLAQNGCNPAWDGGRPLQGGQDAAAIAAIRAAGGDVVPSFGGWSGNKLGPNCATPQALAAAYQQVIDAYNLKAIDIDIENFDEFENLTVQDRILQALKIIKQNNPTVKTIVTFGTETTGPTPTGVRLINQAAAIQAGIDVFTIMPFDFNGGANMYQNTVNASEALKGHLRTAFGWSDAQAYSHMGISGMNGLSDQQELTSLEIWTQIRDWAKSKGLARLAFWSVNRDRPCPGGGVQSACSGIAQPDWEFTRITAGF